MEQYIEKLNNLPIWLKSLILLILMAGGGYYGYAERVETAQAQLDAAKTALQKLETDINNATKEGLSKATLDAKKQKAETDFMNLLELVPKDINIDNLLTSISDSARESGVILIRFQPQANGSSGNSSPSKSSVPDALASAVGELVKQNILTINFEGTYVQNVRFFDKLLGLPRIIRLKNFKFNNQASTQSAAREGMKKTMLKVTPEGAPLLLAQAEFYIFTQKQGMPPMFSGGDKSISVANPNGPAGFPNKNPGLSAKALPTQPEQGE